ncbi:MAG: hypothetical protein L0196_05430 [candidate division Zixibacteria bacterium]|nr:hypothetical protein [candidate division Zixibacteria bacterium]
MPKGKKVKLTLGEQGWAVGAVEDDTVNEPGDGKYIKVVLDLDGKKDPKEVSYQPNEAGNEPTIIVDP